MQGSTMSIEGDCEASCGGDSPFEQPVKPPLSKYLFGRQKRKLKKNLI